MFAGDSFVASNTQDCLLSGILTTGGEGLLF